MNKTGIKKLIRKGEGIFIEFKECRNKLNKDVFESICAFLNRNGGDLILGVNDSGKITGIAPANLSPFPKNPVIARFFKEIGRADELGSGVRNLFKYCRHYSGGKIPELIEEDIFKCIVPLTPEATPQATPQAERVEQICKFCQTPRSSKEIQAHIKIKDNKYFRKFILRPLLEEKVLKPTIPDKPTSPNQKYYTNKEKEKK